MRLRGSSRSVHGLPIGPGSSRGFTLIELLAVVLIITVFAGLAIPAAVVQLRDRRIQESARQIALVYRQARLRAMGRGAAVLVRFRDENFTVLEARQGTAAGECADLPIASCTTPDWNNADESRLVDGHSEAAGGDLGNVSIGIVDSNDTAVTELEVCFTPMGRAFSRELSTALFAPMTEAYLASVSRPGVLRTRNVVLMPNGTARLSAEAAP